jgi:hypothetical protein
LISIRTVSFSVVSLIAIVPDSECRMPTLIGGFSATAAVLASPNTEAASAAVPRRRSRLVIS